MKFFPGFLELKLMLESKDSNSAYMNPNYKPVKDGSRVLYDDGKKFLVKVNTIEAALHWGIYRAEKMGYESKWTNVASDKYTQSIIKADIERKKFYDYYVITLPKEKKTYLLRIYHKTDYSLVIDDGLLHIELFDNIVSYDSGNKYDDKKKSYTTYKDIRKKLIDNGLLKIASSKIKAIADGESMLKMLKDKNSKLVSNGSDILYDRDGEIFIKIKTYIAAYSWLNFQTLSRIPFNHNVLNLKHANFNKKINYIYISKIFNDRYFIEGGVLEPGLYDRGEKGEKRYDKKSEAKKYLDDIRGSNITLVSGKNGEEDYGRFTSEIRKNIKDKELVRLFPGMTKYKSEIGKIVYKVKNKDDKDVKEGTNIVYNDGKNILVEVTNRYADGYWSYIHAPRGMDPLKPNADMILQGDKNFKFTKGSRVYVLLAPDMPKGFNRIKIFKGTNTGHLMYHIIGKFPKDILKSLPKPITKRSHIKRQMLIKLPLETSEYLDNNKFIIDGYRFTSEMKKNNPIHPFFEDDPNVIALKVDTIDIELTGYLEYIFERKRTKRADWTFLSVTPRVTITTVFYIVGGPYMGRRIVHAERGIENFFYDERGKNISNDFKERIMPKYPVIKEYINRGISGSLDTLDRDKMYKEVKKSEQYKYLLKIAVDISTDRNKKSGVYNFTSKELYQQYIDDPNLDIKQIPKIFISPATMVGRYNVKPLNKSDFNPWFSLNDDKVKANIASFYIEAFKWIINNINWKSKDLSKKT